MTTSRAIFKKGRLTVKPNYEEVLEENLSSGVQPLQLSGRRDGFIYVPEGYHAARPAALALMLHGAGGDAKQGLSLLRKFADQKNIVLLAPASRAQSWDIIAAGGFDQDVIFIDQALALIFKRFAIDPRRIAIGGFSDGASYALCLGLSNGDLFTHIIAFSPGFAHTLLKQGKPAIFISHGINDAVLPIEACSRRLVTQLQRLTYQVTYHEFNGGHEIPSAIAEEAVDLLGAATS